MEFFGLKRKTIAIVVLAAVIGFLLYDANKPFRSDTQIREPQVSDIDVEDVQEGVSDITPTGDCELTPEDGQGPYYISDTPRRTNLAPPDAEGDMLEISGQVLNQICEPISDVVVDIWHADSSGEYQDDWFRGRVTTNQDGEYQFETIMPAAYGEGATRRPAHIHYKVWVDGQDVLTSQIYFNGTILPAFAQAKVVEVKPKDDGFEGEFDIVLGI